MMMNIDDLKNVDDVDNALSEHLIISNILLWAKFCNFTIRGGLIVNA